MRNRIIAIFLFLIMCITMSSCDEGITPPGSSVSGQVVYDIGVASNVKVTIGNQSVMTDNEGNFKISNVDFPYDVSVIYFNDDFINVYQGLTNQNPVLNVGENLPAPGSNKASIFPNFPVTPKSQYDLRLYFKPYDNSPVIYYPYLQSPKLDIYWESEIGTLKGKFIVLFENFLQHTYYWYAEKDSVSLSNQQDFNIYFDSTDVMFDPDEKTISATIMSPLTNSIQLGYNQSFTSYRPLGYPHSPIGFSVNNNFSVTVPDNLPIPFDTYIFIRQYSSGGDVEGYFKLNKSGNNIFQLHASPLVISPAENDSSHLYYSDFNWTSVGEEGIYYAHITCNQGPKSVSVYTASNYFRIPDLSSLGFDSFEHGNEFRWTVKKLFYFTGMDEFVSGNFTHNENYMSKSGETNYTNIKLY